MNGYILCYASFTGDDHYLHTYVKVFDNAVDAELEFVSQVQKCFSDCEEMHGTGNWYSCQCAKRSFELASADDRDHWLLTVTSI